MSELHFTVVGRTDVAGPAIQVRTTCQEMMEDGITGVTQAWEIPIGVALALGLYEGSTFTVSVSEEDELERSERPSGY